MKQHLSGYFRLCCIDLLNAYNDAWKCPAVTSHRQAVQHAINQPQPRFWLSPTQSARSMLAMEHGKPPQARRGSNKYKALMHLFDVYKRMKHRFPGQSAVFVTSFACSTQAPRFYLSLDRACRIIEFIRNGRYVL